MKLVCYPAQTRGLSWKVQSEPFPRLEVSLIFGRNKRDKCFIPLVGDIPNDILSTITSPNGVHYECFKSAKNIWLVRQTSKPSEGFLTLITTEGGFRGGVSIHHCDGEIIAKAHASAACESALALAVILKPGQKTVIKTTGRYGSLYHVYRASGDDTVHLVKLSPSEYEYLEGN